MEEIQVNHKEQTIETIEEYLANHNDELKDKIYEALDNSKDYQKAMHKIVTCTMCGKIFDCCDLENAFLNHSNSFDFYVGYGSKHDNEHIKLDLCLDCLDKVIDMIRPMCKTDPVTEDDR
jgi:hypothetical protein